VGGGFSKGEILHGGIYHRINSPEGIFYRSTFLIRVGGIYENNFPRMGISDMISNTIRNSNLFETKSGLRKKFKQHLPQEIFQG